MAYSFDSTSNGYTRRVSATESCQYQSRICPKFPLTSREESQGFTEVNDHAYPRPENISFGYAVQQRHQHEARMWNLFDLEQHQPITPTTVSGLSSTITSPSSVGGWSLWSQPGHSTFQMQSYFDEGRYSLAGAESRGSCNADLNTACSESFGWSFPEDSPGVEVDIFKNKPYLCQDNLQLDMNARDLQLQVPNDSPIDFASASSHAPSRLPNRLDVYQHLMPISHPTEQELAVPMPNGETILPMVEHESMAPNDQRDHDGDEGDDKDPTVKPALTTTQRQRVEQDTLLIQLRKQGLTYRECRERGGFIETVSTLRGRMRSLCNPEHAKRRKPTWTPKDTQILLGVVHKFIQAAPSKKNRFTKHGASPAPVKIRWCEVARAMREEDISYPYGPGSCSKKWGDLMQTEAKSKRRKGSK
ncbi:hypothetical protein K461DRAFT_318853 [Myriangium duriaei CBS 260.36]|uniref:Myb-like domain-containing protein n=1 Tax=Myriangium duriaei CBS 260.36 TaxID=1168546 RepID=A0A9P4J7F0_9PEZI|nr:hypothetical protein K461DRAFT_318853 [Myriangium duriaei CBS 260.36]